MDELSRKPRAILVTGSRHATGTAWEVTVHHRILAIKPSVVIHGDAPGIDTIASHVAFSLNVPRIIALPARWGEEGRAAGPIRNRKMITKLLDCELEGYDIGVEAFHHDILNSKGTLDCVRQSYHAGIPRIHLTNLGKGTLALDDQFFGTNTDVYVPRLVGGWE